MIDEVTTLRFRRIIAALPAEGDSLPLARLAARLASVCQAELSAFMLEDAVLTRLAQLPVARHFAIATGASMPLTHDMLRLAMAGAARRMQGQLSQLPETANLAWSLNAVAVDLASVEADDLVLLPVRIAMPAAWAQRPSGSRPLVAALLVDAEAAQRTITVVPNASREGRGALAMAILLATRTGAMCQILLPAADRGAMQPQIETLVQSAGIRFRVEDIEASTSQAIAAAVVAAGSGLILLPAGPELVQDLQASLRATI